MDSFLTVRMPNRSLETPVRNAPSPLHSTYGHHASYAQSLQTASIRGSRRYLNPHTVSHGSHTPPYPYVSDAARGALRQMGQRKLTLCPVGNFGNGVGSVAGTGWTSAEQLFPSVSIVSSFISLKELIVVFL